MTDSNNNKVEMTNPNNDDKKEIANSNDNTPVKFYGFAITSMVCGIVSIVLLCLTYASVILATCAIVFGAIMLNANKLNPDKTGRSMALTGLILGIVSASLDILCIIGAASLFSLFI